jgi:membrane-associated phospholipid phosphatase
MSTPSTPPRSGEEILPLTTNGALQQQQPTKHPFFAWTAAQVRDTSFCAVFAAAGWNMATVLFYPTQAQIESRPIPLQQIQPSGQFVLDFRYNNPLVDPATIPGDLLIMTGLWAPIIIVLLVEFWLKQQNAHRILCTLFTTLGLSEFFTNVLKFWVRRPRPNYYELCGFNIDTKTCMAPFEKIVQAQLSFPSGHTSLSFCGTTVLALWFFHLIMTAAANNNNNKTPFQKIKLILACLVPWGWATFVAVSRIVDYWHHPSDILAGCLLGTTCATLSFVVHYIMGSGGSHNLATNKLASFHE